MVIQLLSICTITGTGLALCATDQEQCCTPEYINEVRREAREELVEGLLEEYEDTLDNFNDIVDDVLVCRCHSLLHDI